MRSLLLRGARWRLGVSLLTVLTATIAVATAVLGPMYLYTAGDSVLRQTVDSAPVQDSGVDLSTLGGEPRSLEQMTAAARLLRRSRGGTRYGAPITTEETGVKIPVPGGGAANSQLFARTGICGVLHFVKGGCARTRNEVAVSVLTVRLAHVRVGGLVSAYVTGRDTPLRLRISGIYAVPDLGLPYWWGDGNGDFPFGATGNGPSQVPLTDPLVTQPATALAVPSHAVPTVIEQLPLRDGTVDLHDESAVRRDLGALTAELKTRRVALGTHLPQLMSDADGQRHAMAAIVAIAATQLVVLAIWVLGSLLVRSSDARAAEARVARLRGFTPGGLVWVTAAEPAVLCLVGAALGVAIADATVVVARGQLFVSGSAIAFDGWAIAALALTLLAIAAALGLGTARLLRTARLGEAAGGPRRAGSVASLVADAVLVVLAIVALVALGTTGALNGHDDPLASVAPGLIALGTAVLAIHVILFAARVGIAMSAQARWVAPFLALRQTVRRPAVLRQARVLIIALCFACFATAAWSVARSNRSDAAEFEIGAHRVLQLAPTSTATLQRAVARVDPQGRWAMPAVDLRTRSTNLLAVEASRLNDVASWPSGVSRAGLARVARTIAPPAAAQVVLAGRSIAVTARATPSGPLARRLGRVHLNAWLFSATGGTSIIDLGELRAGKHTYRAGVAAECPGGCRLSGLGVLTAAATQGPIGGAVKLALTHIGPVAPSARGRSADADLGPGGWRPDDQGIAVSARPTRGLVLTVQGSAITNSSPAGPTTPPMAGPADHPRVLPAVATTELAELNSGAVGPLFTEGLDGETVSYHPDLTASALPRVGADAAMVDLGLLSGLQVNPNSPHARDEVWLGASAPRDAVARLLAAGLSVQKTDDSATVFDRLQHTGPALADDFLLFATLAALLVAAASTLGALGATTRARATELASLELAGVPRITLVRALGLEAAILLLTALCGAGAGVLAAVLAVPSLPALTSPTLAPPNYTLPAGLIVLVTAVVVAAVALAAAGITAVLLRRMSPTLLRTAPDEIAG